MYGYIYLIVNKVNGKTYVGQHKSNNWKDNYMGSGVKLKLAQKKYGIGNFEKFLIQYCETKEELDKQEIFWIAEYRSRGKAEYNIAKGGSGVVLEVNGMFGKKHSEETKKLMSEHNCRYWSTHKVSDETKRKISEHHKGRPVWNKGKYHTEETKTKISNSLKDKSSWNKGIKWTEERRLKMLEIHKQLNHDRNSGKHWFTNGEINILTYECPNGFRRGRV